MRRILTSSLLFILLLSGFAQSAAVPNSVSYQGRLTTASNTPVADGPYLVKFVIYNAAAGGTALWDAGFQTVTTVDGLFTVQLGASPMPILPTNLFSDTLRFLGITVGTDPELTPRSRLITVPYAFQSRRADSADAADKVAWTNVTGIPAGFADGTDNDAGGDISGVTAGTGLTGGGTSGGVTLNVATGGITSSLIQDGGVANVDLAGSIDPTKVSGTAVTLSGSQTITGSKTFDGGTTVFGDSTMRVDGNGVRIGDATAPSSGLLLSMDRQYATTFSRTGIDLNLQNSSNASLVGVDLEIGSTSDAGGPRYGVYCNVNNALASAGLLYGVYARAGSSSKTAGNSYGVYGEAYAGVGSIAVGVYGIEIGSGANYAGYFQGNVNVNGTLSKTSGAFRIDHPLDPENKYLQHSFVESPDMMNIYNGNVTLSADGSAVVTLPDYFQALNMEFRYQLTAIGAPGPNLFIAEKVNGNQFKIAGGISGMEVSWQVTGVRQDAYAKANRIQIELDKPARERGTYIAPEEHGQPLSKHVNWEQIKESQEREALEESNNR